MLSKQGEHLVFVGEEGDNAQRMLHYLLDPWQATHVLHEQIKTMRTWSPHNLWELRFNHLAHCFTIGSIVGHHLDNILQPDLHCKLQHTTSYIFFEAMKYETMSNEHTVSKIFTSKIACRMCR